jgi:hypothetical protein
MRFPTRQLLGVIVAAALLGGCRESAPAPSAPAAAPVSLGSEADAKVVAEAPPTPAPAAKQTPDVAPTPPLTPPEPNVAERPEPAEAAPAQQFDGHKLAILHTANMAGELEPCG